MSMFMVLIMLQRCMVIGRLSTGTTFSDLISSINKFHSFWLSDIYGDIIRNKQHITANQEQNQQMFSRSVASAVEANKTTNIERISLLNGRKTFEFIFPCSNLLTKSVLYRSYNQ